MADQDLELRRRVGRVVSLALPAFLPSAISFLPEIKGLGSGPPGPSPRFATEECRSWISSSHISLHKMVCERNGHFQANPCKKNPLVYSEAGRNFEGALSRYLATL